MSRVWKPGSLRCWLALFLFVGLAATPFAAAQAAAPSPCFGLSYLEIVSDRTRLIQGSCVIVAFGIALLWWKK